MAHAIPLACHQVDGAVPDLRRSEASVRPEAQPLAQPHDDKGLTTVHLAEFVAVAVSACTGPVAYHFLHAAECSEDQVDLLRPKTTPPPASDAAAH